MMHQQGRIGTRAATKHLQHLTVPHEPLDQRHAQLDRPPGQLMAEPDPPVTDVQHAAALGLGQPVQVTDQRDGDVEVHRRRDHRQPGYCTLRGHGQLVQPAQDRVDHAAGHLRVRGGEHLGDEERVAARRRVQRHRVRLRTSQRRHARRAQPLQLQTDPTCPDSSPSSGCAAWPGATSSLR